MDWLTELIEGIGTAISDAFKSMWDIVSDSIWEVYLKWIYEAIYGAIADFFTLIGNMGMDIFDLPWVQAFLKLFNMFGWALFISGLVVAVFDIAIEYQSMHQLNIKRQMLPILVGFLAVNLFTVLPVKLYTFCLTIQNTFMHDLADLFATDISSGKNFTDVAIAALATIKGATSIFNLLTLITLGYCVVKIFFANIKRGGILITQIAVGSLHLFSLPKGYSEGFFTWCRQILALCITSFLQMTLLYLGLLTWQTNMLLGLGIMLSANEVPQIAQMFGLDTSVKVNMMSAVHSTTTAINLTRAIIKK